MKVVALAGGVGGAKLADGLAQHLPPEDLTVVVNVGDDFEHLGLKICPDLDTVCYTLAGKANPVTGWGQVDETWKALESLAALGGPTWFRLGDRDLGTHLERTRRLRDGQTLSQITADFCRAWGISLTVLPATDEIVPTRVYTEEGDLAFQDYFVRRQCHPRVTGFYFEGVKKARPAPGVLEALRDTDLVVICPSNPWVSIDPVLAIPDMMDPIKQKPVLAVSPIVGGQAVKGPAAKMYAELGIQPSAASVASHYRRVLTAFVMDQLDSGTAGDVRQMELPVLVTDTMMRSVEDRRRLAVEVLQFAENIV